MNDSRLDMLTYLKDLQNKKEDRLENEDFSKVFSVAYGLELDIKALGTVIDIIEEDMIENELN